MTLQAAALTRVVEGIALDLPGLHILPGMVNAHDHLEFALFPRLGHGPYPNATAWARDIYHPEQSPIREHLRVPKPLRLLWGGLRNLVSGVTTVSHHNPYEPTFTRDFPVRVLQQYGWAHSFSFGADVAESLAATPPGAPFLIHLAEGTDRESAQEIFRLEKQGALNERTVLIHCVGLTDEGWNLVWESGASVVWCPQSNLFTLGRTISSPSIPQGIPIALGTDSPLTSHGDLLDEIRIAQSICNTSLCETVTQAASSILRLAPNPQDWIATSSFGQPPELVVIGGRIHLISPSLAEQLPNRDQFYPFQLQGRPPVLVRWNIPRLLEETRRHLGSLPVHLGGREVSV